MTAINFSCTTIPVDDVLRCSWNLTKTELNVLKALDDEVTTKDIRDQHGISISLAQRTLKKLHDHDLVTRRQVNRRDGGYVYVYERRPNDELVNNIQAIIDAGAAGPKK
jgi:predicted transcriptional regulator